MSRRAISATTKGRIATGRDAAFLDNHHGAITLNAMTITAIVDGELLIDTLDQVVSLR